MSDALVLPLLVPLADVPAAAVERLLDDAFGTDRHTRTAYRIRRGMAPLPGLSLAALDEGGALVGSLQCWPIALHGHDGGETPLTLVGPVAVAPAMQRSGLGRTMMHAMLAAAEGADPLVLIGDPEYYGRFFGFTADATAGWRAPGPVDRRRLLARGEGLALPADGMLGPRTFGR